jgi:hypothetical protein
MVAAVEMAFLLAIARATTYVKGIEFRPVGLAPRFLMQVH